MAKNKINGCRVWLCRDYDGWYHVGADQKPYRGRDDDWAGVGTSLCPELFALAFPDIYLKPGEGPIEVSIDIREIK